MKNALIFSVFIALLFVLPAKSNVVTSYNTLQQSGNVEVHLKVLGLCGMCKTRIEKAAYSVRGVSKAEWNQEKQMLNLTYRANRTNQESIERAIAKAGHDTENFITDEKTWENLHHCCKYPRNPEWLKKNKQYDEE